MNAFIGIIMTGRIYYQSCGLAGDPEALAECCLGNLRGRRASRLPPCVSDMWEL